MHQDMRQKYYFPTGVIDNNERLRDRFVHYGATALEDHELLELMLLRAISQTEASRLATILIEKFGSFAEVLAAPPHRLKEIKGICDHVVTEFKISEATIVRFMKAAVKKKNVLGSYSAVIDYCHAAMAYSDREEFRVLFLNKKNGLIADEVQGTGTVDHTPVYPRELVKRALELSACAVIMVHNHPSGDPTPSEMDIRITQDVVRIATPMGINVHDHLIVGRDGHSSFRRLKLI